jgi:hypothetical protein
MDCFVASLLAMTRRTVGINQVILRGAQERAPQDKEE